MSRVSKVYRGLEAQAVFADLPAYRVQKVKPVKEASKENVVKQEHKESQDQRESQDKMVKMELMVYKERKVMLDPRGQLGKMVDLLI